MVKNENELNDNVIFIPLITKFYKAPTVFEYYV